jgi:hypothetical protein
MGKHRSKNESTPVPTVEASTPVPEVAADAAVIPKMALAGVEQLKLPPPRPADLESQAIELKTIEATAVEVSGIGDGNEARVELAGIEAPRIIPDIDVLERSDSDDAAAAANDEPAAEGPARRVVPRFTTLAASLAVAAALGAMVGALGAYTLTRPAALPDGATARVALQEIQALKENVVQARVELAGIKVSLEAGNRSANAQFTRIGERIERIERVQAEPASRLSKAIEALERASRSDAAAPKEVTGSIAPPPPPPLAAAPAIGGVVDGWVVREVHRNTALIEGRLGLIEVDRGDIVPGLGRIESFRKQDGRWVVVTTKGLIMSAH